MIYGIKHVVKGNYKRMDDNAQKFALFIFCTLTSVRQVSHNIRSIMNDPQKS